MYSFLFKMASLISLTMMLSNACRADAMPVAQPLTLTQAKTEAQQRNPMIAARRAQANALAFKPAQVASLPDPVLSLGALSVPTDTFSTTQEAMTQMQLGYSQSMPFPGKLDLQAKSEDYLAKAAVDDVDELNLQLVERVEINWWNLFYLDRALEAVTHNQQLLRQLIRIAQSKYKVGKGLQQDVLLAQLELSRLLDHKIQLDAARKLEATRLNTLLSRSAELPVTLPENMNEELPTIQSGQSLTAEAFKTRPLLAKHVKQIEAAQARSSLADKAYYPDFKVGASYSFRGENPQTGLDRADLASVTLSMTLPFFTGGKQDALVGQRQAELAAEGFKYQDVKNEVIAEITLAKTRYEQSKSQVALFKSGILPQARQTVASMLAAYQVNKVDFLNLVRAQVTLYNYETQYWKVFAEARQALAQLHAAVGKDVAYE